MNVLVQTPYGDFEMSVECENLRCDDQGISIALICEAPGWEVQYEVERRFPQLPIEIQERTFESPRDGRQVMKITPVHLEFRVWETKYFRDGETGKVNYRFSIAWFHPMHVQRLQMYIERDYDQNTYFFRQMPDQVYSSVRALLEATLKPSLCPILLADEYMNHPDLLRK